MSKNHTVHTEFLGGNGYRDLNAYCDIEEDIDGWVVYVRENTPQDPQ